MNDDFIRQGALTDEASYPAWVQDMLQTCASSRARLANHEFVHRMRDAELTAEQFYTFMVALWPVIEQFPQYMAHNLLKVQYGRVRGHDMARRYLIRNIRVEQSHADHWVDWAACGGVGLDDLLYGSVPLEAHALRHWCWHTCERDSLAAAMAATNYAIEGVTGDVAILVCSQSTYADTFAPADRSRAMRWLKVHAHYDDTHPWEALEIVCTIVGNDPTPRGAAMLTASVQKSYEYLRLTFDHCLTAVRGDVRSLNAPAAARELKRA